MSDWWELLSGYVSDLAVASWTKAMLAFVLTTGMGFFGLDHPPIEALMILMACDYALGFAHAWKEGGIDFGKMRRGLGKCVVYAMALNVAWLADRAMGLPLDAGYSLRTVFCSYLAGNEAFSALTHLGAFGVPFPVWLKVRLRSYSCSLKHPILPRNPGGPDNERHGN